MEKAIADHQISSLSPDWQRNLLSSSPPAAMVESFDPNLRSQPLISSLLSGITPVIAGKFHPSLSPFPATDAAFVERAARFSCFNGGSIMNSSTPPPLVTPQIQNTEFTSTQAGAVFSPGNGGAINGSPVMNQEANTESANAVCGSSSNNLQGKKGKRNDQQSDNAKANPELEENNSKPGGRNVKDKSESPKGDYVHIRARRGQATNSHSLAERVRREKISERMKYLQDLVPSCSKVTGKAVMLDEIINYVQSLQRQVEFLSMKLAAVNPGLDYNVEELLAKDVLQPYAACSYFAGLSREIAYPLMHPSQQSFLPGGNFHDPAESVWKLMNSQLTNEIRYKDPTLQVQNSWNQDIPNLVLMTYEANLPFDVQEPSNKPQ